MLAEILHKIGFDWRVALSHTVNIAIIFFLLVKFALPKIKATINKRTEDIRQGLKNKEASEEVLVNAHTQAGEIKKIAQAEKVQIVSQAKTEAEGLVAKGSQEAQVIVESARKDFQSAKQEGYAEGAKLFERKLTDILQVINNKAFAGAVSPEVESAFIKKVFTEHYEK